MLFSAECSILQLAPPFEEPLLSCILESEVRHFCTVFDESTALEKVHVGQPPDNLTGALLGGGVRILIHYFPAGQFVWIDQHLKTLDQSIVVITAYRLLKIVL